MTRQPASRFKGARSRGFGLLEILVIIGIAALVVVLSYPGYKRAGLREKAERLRSDLVDLEKAVAAASAELKAPPGSMLSFDQFKKYLKNGSVIQKTGEDPFGNAYGPQNNSVRPAVPEKSAERLRAVVPEGFWGGFSYKAEL
jgi:type II secretory pathway pseudopilin PulG